jgi:transcriptional regulator with XRE-family HTH domain
MNTKPPPADIAPVLKEIGSRLRTQRKSVAKNYEDFARDHQFNKVTISRIENGENFTMSSLIQVLRVLDISIEDFFKGIK